MEKRRTVPKEGGWTENVEEALELKTNKRLTMPTNENKEEFHRTRAQTKRLLRTKKNYLEPQIREIDRDRGMNQTMKFVRAVKRVGRNGSVGGTKGMRNESGELIMTETEIVERWKEYF